MIENIALAANEQAQVSENVAIAMGQISEITRQTNTGTQEAAMSVSYLAELADQLRASVATFRLPEHNNEMVDVYPSMSGVPALPGGNSGQFYQQEIGMNNDWNQGFSGDFLSLPQPQASGSSGAFQFSFNNQQDYGVQQGFAGMPQYGGQQPYGDQQYGSQQGFEGQQFGNQAGFDGQQYGNQRGFNGQQFGSQMNAGGQQFGSQPRFNEMNGFEDQQGFEGQQQFMPESAFGGLNQAPGEVQQNFGLQQGQSMATQQRWRNPQQNQPSFGQDQIPFPNSGHTGQ